MIIFLLVLIFLAILWPGLIRWTLAMLLVMGLFSIHAHADDRDASHCIGTLTWAGGLALFDDEHNRTPCSIISDKDEKRVRKVCAIGSKCEIWGIIRLCKHDSDCVEITHITDIIRRS